MLLSGICIKTVEDYSVVENVITKKRKKRLVMKIITRNVNLKLTRSGSEQTLNTSFPLTPELVKGFVFTYVNALRCRAPELKFGEITSVC